MGHSRRRRDSINSKAVEICAEVQRWHDGVDPNEARDLALNIQRLAWEIVKKIQDQLAKEGQL